MTMPMGSLVTPCLDLLGQDAKRSAPVPCCASKQPCYNEPFPPSLILWWSFANTNLSARLLPNLLQNCKPICAALCSGEIFIKFLLIQNQLEHDSLHEESFQKKKGGGGEVELETFNTTTFLQGKKSRKNYLRCISLAALIRHRFQKGMTQ